MSHRNPYHATVVAMLNHTRHLLTQLGPEEGLQLLERSMARMERVVESYHGKVTDTSNWTLTAQFREMETAQQAAQVMEQRIAQLPPAANNRITVSIGVAKTANLAMARALTESSHVDSLLAEIPSINYRPREVASGPHLVLRYRHQTLIVDDRRKELTLGRSSQCGLVIDHPLASGIHARVIKDQERFVLLDSSTNGTFIRAAQGKEKFLHQRLHFLTGQGIFSLAEIPERATPYVIEFEVMAA